MHLKQEVAVGRQGDGLGVANVGQHVGDEQVLGVEGDIQEEPGAREPQLSRQYTWANL